MRAYPRKKIGISDFLKAWLNLKEKVIPIKKSSLTGKTIVFTGELKSFNRNQAKAMVRQMGGNSSSSITKDTDFVISGENPGSKYAQAKKLGIKIINEEEFSRLVGQE